MALPSVRTFYNRLFSNTSQQQQQQQNAWEHVPYGTSRRRQSRDQGPRSSGLSSSEPFRNTTVRSGNAPVQGGPHERGNFYGRPGRNGFRNERINTENEDFGLLINLLFAVCQLRHHLGNWLNLPRSINNNIDTFFSSVNPPRSDNTLSADMTQIKNILKYDIQETIHEHIQKQLEQARNKLKHIDPTDKHKAKVIVRNKSIKNIPRIDRNNLDIWIDESIDLIGINRYETNTQTKQPHGNTTQQHTTLNTTTQTSTTTSNTQAKHSYSSVAQQRTTSNTTTKQTYTSTLATTNSTNIAHNINNTSNINGASNANLRPKRSLPLSPPTSINNRFQVLEVLVTETPSKVRKISQHSNITNVNVASPNNPMETEVSSVNTSDSVGPNNTPTEQAESSIPVREGERKRPPTKRLSLTLEDAPFNLQSSTSRLRSNSQSNLTDFNGYYNNRNNNAAIIHTESNKSEWNLRPRSKARTIVIADSNFRYCNTNNNDYEVHVYPGAYLSNACNILDSSILTDCVQDIVIAVGINHRSWNYEKSTAQYLRRLVSISKRVKQRVHFLGVSAPQLPTKTDNDNIVRLNREARDKFGSERFIAPIAQSHVSIRENDTSGIHHDQNTVSKIFGTIVDHMSLIYSLHLN